MLINTFRLTVERLTVESNSHANILDLTSTFGRTIMATK
jgi:hypothetical protein